MSRTSLWSLALLTFGAAALFHGAPLLLRRLIKHRLGGYRRLANAVDLSLPERSSSPRRVAVIGAGVAGITAALTLARRGFSVVLFEAKPYLGGKIGSWPVQLASGEEVMVSHGFHAFFPHYHNLNRLLDSLGLRRPFARIEDYVILRRGDVPIRFGALDRTPVFNLLALARAGVFRLGEALRAPGRDLYGLFLEYEHDDTFARYDHVSFETFNSLARVPPRLKLAFNTFARAFFADEQRLSLAEVLKSFHFYYLGQDGGLLYDYPVRDYQSALLDPLRAALEAQAVTIRLATPVQALARREASFMVDGESFDKVVLCTDVVGARAIVTQASGLPPALCSTFAKLLPGQRYAVLRVWIDRDVRPDLPVFVITDRLQILDAIAIYHRLEQESRDWVGRHGGGVLELHCYAVPDSMSESEVRSSLLSELQQFLPELEGVTVRHEALQVRRDFTAFHVGMYRDRPTVATGVPGLVCAGDWVKLPFPAMLLEAACASGLCAANQLLTEEGLREEPVHSVPLRGLMAGMPQPPGRRVLDRPVSGPPSGRATGANSAANP